MDQFYRFTLHYGFKAQFCNPGKGHEKGHVENKVGYSRRNFFVPEPAFDDIEVFNHGLFAAAEVWTMTRKGKVFTCCSG